MRVHSALARSLVASIPAALFAMAAGPGVATAAGNFNSCSVVTRAEAAGALGQAVTAGVLGHATVEGGLACVFYGPSVPPALRDPDVAVGDSVRVVVVNGANALKWYKDYESKVKAQPVKGIGKQAFFDGYAFFERAHGPLLPARRRQPTARPGSEEVPSSGADG